MTAAAIRVLFVEDSSPDVELMVYELRRGGLDPTFSIVDTSDAMKSALEGEPWDVVIADHGMPRFSAPDALQVLKSSGFDLPFIVVSGSIGEELAVACMKAGANDYVIKNNLARLAPAVQRELREAKERRRRLELEESYRKTEELYRLLVENMADLITVVDREGRITYQSPSVKRVLGYEHDEIIGTLVLDHVHPDDRGRATEAFEDTMARGGPTSLSGMRFRHRDGTWRVIEGSGARFVDPAGVPYLIATSRDISERVRLEEQLHQAQRVEAVGRLAGGVAHDFNNLLTVILGYSNLLLDQLAQQPMLFQEVDEIKRAATRAAGLTHQLLAFSRKQVLTLKVLNLNAIVEGMGQMLQRLVGENIDLSLRLHSSLGRVRVDPGQIEQVIMNLVINAGDAMPQGGRLTVETANVELDESFAHSHVAVKPGAYVMLAVCDTGIGMDAQTQARLFEPFFTTKEPGKGTGLGLSTVYGIVKQCNGNIFVYSEPGRGTCLRIYLPRLDAPVDRTEPSRDSDAPRAGNETVLLVEDEGIVRALVRDILRKQGYAVLEVTRGEEALALSRGHRGTIHLMVTDVVMPGMSGVELSRQLEPERPEMKVLYLSGYSDDMVARQGAFRPGTAFLQKPFTPEILLRKVREVLEQSRGGSSPGSARSDPATGSPSSRR